MNLHVAACTLLGSQGLGQKARAHSKNQDGQVPPNNLKSRMPRLVARTTNRFDQRWPTCMDGRYQICSKDYRGKTWLSPAATALEWGLCWVCSLSYFSSQSWSNTTWCGHVKANIHNWFPQRTWLIAAWMWPLLAKMPKETAVPIAVASFVTNNYYEPCCLLALSPGDLKRRCRFQWLLPILQSIFTMSRSFHRKSSHWSDDRLVLFAVFARWSLKILVASRYLYLYTKLCVLYFVWYLHFEVSAKDCVANLAIMDGKFVTLAVALYLNLALQLIWTLRMNVAVLNDLEWISQSMYWIEMASA